MSTTVPGDPVFQRLIPYLQGLDHRPVIVEIGMHWGSSTCLLLTACSWPPYYYGFEPDPRNLAVLREIGYDAFPLAISDKTGKAKLYMSTGTDPQGRTHTASSSIRLPTAHLEAFPWCNFEQNLEVDTVRLDDVCGGEERIDLIWCDVQGAQREVLAGATECLKKTKLLYIEVHPTPMYDGEPTYEELLEILPGFKVVEKYEADVLLERED